jgi:hypothetical protein
VPSSTANTGRGARAQPESSVKTIIHPALVSDSDEIAANYIQEMLNMAFVDRMFFSSFAMPSKRSEDSELGSHGPVFVTGVINSPDILRLRAVRSISPANLSVIWTPMQPGRGISFTTCPEYTEYVKNCSKLGSDSTNPDALIRIDARGGSNNVRPKKTGPKAPRKPSMRGVPPPRTPAPASGTCGGGSTAPVAAQATPASPTVTLPAEPEVRPPPFTPLACLPQPRRASERPLLSPASHCSRAV